MSSALLVSVASAQRRKGSGTLKASRGKQPGTAGHAGHPTEDRSPARYSRTPVRARQGWPASRPRNSARSAGPRAVLLNVPHH
jgi:hypothetical protein